MQVNFVKFLAIAGSLAGLATASLAASSAPVAANQAQAVASAPAKAHAVVKAKAVTTHVAKTKAGKPAKSAPPKLVDINSASKAELMKLPEVNAASADKIIQGRPYGSAAFLVTRHIVSPEAFQVLKLRVIALQKNSPKPSSGGKGTK